MITQDAIEAMNVETRNVVFGFLEDRKPFTHTDVSNAVKKLVHEKTGKMVGHKYVRDIILDIFDNSDELGNNNFVRSPITVYPPTRSTGVGAYLYHPDDFDCLDYNDLSQEAWKPNSNSSEDGVVSKMSFKSSNIDMTDDGVTGDTHAKNGAEVTKQCSVQPNRRVLNIPAIMVSSAGWKVGDTVQVDHDNSSNILTVKRSISGAQAVDSEGRVRVYGKNLSQIGKSPSDRCDTMLVKDNDSCYIVVQ